MARGSSKQRQRIKTLSGEQPINVVAAKADRPVEAGKTNPLRPALLCAGIVFLVALILYSWTLAPTVTFVDSGELIVVARFLGVAHPPGFPLWAMLGHLASLFPWGNIAARVNFSSALFAALACGMLTLVVAELMIAASYVAPKRPPTKRSFHQDWKTRRQSYRETANEGSESNFLIYASALGSGLLLACSLTLWAYATITEVYALNTFLFISVFFLIAHWRRRTLEEMRRSGTAVIAGQNLPSVTVHDVYLYAGSIVFGLALGVHHVTVALTLPAVAIIVYRTQGLRFFLSRRLLFSALVSFAALIAVYTYLPLAAARSPIINWGDPRTFEQIWWHITGRQYQVFLTFSLSEMGTQFWEFCQMVSREFGVAWIPVALVFAAIGFHTAFKRDRTVFWFLALILGVNLLYCLSYTIAEDKDAYYLPPFVSLMIAIGFGFHRVMQLALSTSTLERKGYVSAALPVALVAGIAFMSNWPLNNRRHYFIASDYVDNLLKAIQPNGLVLTTDWQVASPILYTREIEGRRQDVKVIDVKLLHRLWYFDYLKHAYPDLVERSRDKIDPFVTELTAWEHNPAAYANDQTLNLRINTLFQEMLHAIIDNENAAAPVYITEDLPFADRREPELTKWINQNFQLVAQGLVFKLENSQTFHDSPDLELQLRGLADGTLHFEKDDVVNQKVLPVYASMFVNRGRYLASFNEHERAVTAFRQALAVNPDYAVAKQGLEESLSKLRNR